MSLLLFIESVFAVGRIELRGHRLIIWDLGGQEDLRTLWDKVCIAPSIPVSIFWIKHIQLLSKHCEYLS